MKKIIVFELNEFNDDLLRVASNELGLKNIQKVLSYNKIKLITDDTYESDYLEPWVQWVSSHTGTPSQQHLIKHLGDISELRFPQIWEILSQKNITSGIWGLMNASRNESKNCLFFVPDPWTFSEQAYPDELNPLLDLPRYMSKNYLNLSKKKIAKKLLHLLAFIFKAGIGKSFLAELPYLIKNIIQFKGEHFVFICFIDYISTLAFLSYKEKYNPDLSMLFLNGIAHLQHHHWEGFDYKKNKRLIYGLRYVDKILKKIFEKLNENHNFIMMTPLTQVNTNAETPWLLYRQIDQVNFLKTAGMTFEKVEPHMTYDAHILFSHEKDCDEALQILQEARIREQPLFLIEVYPHDKKKLFYRVNFSESALPEEKFIINGKSFKFFDFFQVIVQRTGKHIPEGSIYSNNTDILQNEMYNHDFFSYLLSLFKVHSPEMESHNRKRVGS